MCPHENVRLYWDRTSPIYRGKQVREMEGKRNRECLQEQFQTVILVKFWVYEVSETRSIHGISSVINQYIGLVIKLLWLGFLSFANERIPLNTDASSMWEVLWSELEGILTTYKLNKTSAFIKRFVNTEQNIGGKHNYL